MRTNNNKHLITNEKVWIRQLFIYFSYVTSLSTSEVSGAINISSSHTNTYLHNFYFTWTILVSKYLSILHAIVQSHLHALGFPSL